MKKILSIVLFTVLVISTYACKSNPSTQKKQSVKNMTQTTQLDTITLGAGCFWCIEAIFQDLKGVNTVISGYTGGKVANPSYEEICTGTTGHAEVAQITFDPKIISLETILEVFWTTHDPTTLNRQGNDIGTQYRSAIFYRNDTQKAIAEKSKKEFATTIWEDPIVTEITPLTDFYPAENYHQNYFNDNSTQPYCKFVINPKVQKMRAKFQHLLK